MIKQEGAIGNKNNNEIKLMLSVNKAQRKLTAIEKKNCGTEKKLN